MSNNAPIVMISSYPPRLCGIGTFTEEAREFIQKRFPDREVLVISHLDGRGDGVIPIIDMNKRYWWKPVVKKIEELQPYAVHIEHEYGLYEYYDARGQGDFNDGFIAMLNALSDVPVVVEPHTVHGRLRDQEADFLFRMCNATNVVLFKAAYQKWRLDWNFRGFGWEVPRNILVVPHGARSDKRWGPSEIPELRKEIGLDKVHNVGDHLIGMVGWIQSNKRWDIFTSMWEEVADEIKRKTGQKWDLLAAGSMRDPNHLPDYRKYREEVELLEKKGLAHYYEFIPRGDIYYKVMAVCDFIVLPSTDETQSGTLARIFSLNKPYITTAPMEGLTSQTIESEGGLLFTNRETLRRGVIRLATDEGLRHNFGENLKRYLDNVVSWEVVANQYAHAYELARESVDSGQPVILPQEF